MSDEQSAAIVMLAQERDAALTRAERSEKDAARAETAWRQRVEDLKRELEESDKARDVLCSELERMTDHSQAMREQRDAALALVAQLEAVVEACRLVIGTGNTLDDFEALADRYYRATGRMAPGKDDVRMLAEDDDENERRRAFRDFIDRERRDAQRALSALPAPAKGDE